MTRKLPKHRPYSYGNEQQRCIYDDRPWPCWASRLRRLLHWPS